MKFVFIIIILFFINISAQNVYEKKYLEVIPGEEYEQSRLFEVFFGHHWRDLWVTPITVEVLDLEKFDGGLTPIKKGGGFQTKSLRLITPKGVQWKFRSINKDPSKVLPEELSETFAADILKDQISSSNPMAPLVAGEILEAVDVIQSKPILVYMPDDEKLGEYRDEFKNVLGFIEIHPDEFEDGTSTVEGSDKIKGTYKLLETIEDKRSNRINSADYLKARLVDFLINDWDRHTDQWRWARFQKDTLKFWSPIPRDRDQAFAKYTGLFPYLASVIVPQLNHFGEGYSNVKYQAWSGRYLDRRFLIELNKSEWDSVTNFVYNRISDEVIEKSVAALPNEYYEIAGDEIITKLKSRRNKLKDISNDFYELTNEVAHIYGTIDKDFIEVNFYERITEIKIYKLDKETGSKKEQSLFTKVIDNKITDEVRLFLLEDDDKVVVNGIGENVPTVRIIGDKGKDIIINNSTEKLLVYDDKEKTIFDNNEFIQIDESYPRISEIPEIRFEPQYNQQGSEYQIFPSLTISSDDGFLFGGFIDYWTYSFNKYPYSTFHQADFYYSTLLNSYSINYNGTFNNLFDKHSLKISASKTEIEYGNFFGFGNDTKYSKDLFEKDYYRARNEIVKISSSILFNRKSMSNFEAGLTYWYYEAQEINLNLLQTYKYFNYGLNGIKLLSLDFSFKHNSVDNIYFPTDGMNMDLRINTFPTIIENESTFAKFLFDLRYYKSIQHFNKTVLALRTSGEHILGNKIPFYLIPMLGGKNSLRGYDRERFAGNSLIFFQSELRNYLFNFDLIIPFNFGISFSAETGRVFIEGDMSQKWHPAYGFGIFATSFEDTAGFSFTTIFSEESTQFYLRTKMGF